MNRGSDHVAYLVSGGVQRSALVHIPPVLDATTPGRAVPAVANFHTMAETGEMMARLTHMSDLADQEGFVVVYPEGLEKANVQGWLPGGIGHTWNGGTCCPKESTSRVDDVGFARALVHALPSIVANLSHNMLSIDPRRIYAAGGSNGAFMVNRIACQAPDLFAAVAPVSGLIGNGTAVVWGSDP
jgi:polyhydroxybutyrate depolymerase